MALPYKMKQPNEFFNLYRYCSQISELFFDIDVILFVDQFTLPVEHKLENIQEIIYTQLTGKDL